MEMEYDRLMRLAREEAKRHHHKYIRTEHLLLALIRLVPVDMIQQWGLNADCIGQAVAGLNCPTCSAEEQMVLSASAERAYQLAQSIAQPYPIASHHLLLGILQSSLTVRRILETCDIQIDMLTETIESEFLYGSS